jgi:hypothetical protein
MVLGGGRALGDALGETGAGSVAFDGVEVGGPDGLDGGGVDTGSSYSGGGMAGRPCWAPQPAGQMRQTRQTRERAFHLMRADVIACNFWVGA